MAPMIRVDDEVYEMLNDRGRTEDSFNDVIRRELGLSPATPRKARAKHPVGGIATQPPMGLTNSAVEAALSRYLPPQWSDAPARRDQVLEVVYAFLETPREWSTADREVYAARQVAKTRGIEINTVQDKCGRQLYGQGNLIERFRTALEAVEAELRGKDD